MSDDKALVKGLRAMARCEHDDLSMGGEAADAIERLTRERDEAADEIVTWAERAEQLVRERDEARSGAASHSAALAVVAAKRDVALNELALANDDFDGLIRFAESLGIHGSENASEAFTRLCHRWEDAQSQVAALREALAGCVGCEITNVSSGHPPFPALCASHRAEAQIILADTQAAAQAHDRARRIEGAELVPASCKYELCGGCDCHAMDMPAVVDARWPAEGGTK